MSDEIQNIKMAQAVEYSSKENPFTVTYCSALRSGKFGDEYRLLMKQGEQTYGLTTNHKAIIDRIFKHKDSMVLCKVWFVQKNSMNGGMYYQINIVDNE